MAPNTIYEDGDYLENNPTWHAEDSPWKARQITKILNSNNILPTTICEIGCGTGEILNCLAKEKAFDEVQFSGYDISPQAIEISRQKQQPRLQFFQEDFLQKTGISFDVVMAIDVIEHVEDNFTFLRKLKNKGTYKIFHIPLDLSVNTVLRGAPLLYRRHKVGHIHYFTKDTALALLKDTGYEVVSYFYTNSASELPNITLNGTLMKLPRKLLFSLNPDLAVRVLGGFSLLVLTK